ncbi:hypothetical protein PRN20_05175 [Devosia sp. ZB163]|uniref:hypothetical protein n=1 Tax=Devosia sp. ZB163 TaxID=3025938 RepID=UPI002362F491|nr:hypothetical protein [Devosia sp. ZB163]MDC9823117.1 hypothetical protein [Devosia sp. ZB163]
MAGAAMAGCVVATTTAGAGWTGGDGGAAIWGGGAGAGAVAVGVGTIGAGVGGVGVIAGGAGDGCIWGSGPVVGGGTGCGWCGMVAEVDVGTGSGDAAGWEGGTGAGAAVATGAGTGGDGGTVGAGEAVGGEEGSGGAATGFWATGGGGTEVVAGGRVAGGADTGGGELLVGAGSGVTVTCGWPEGVGVTVSFTGVPAGRGVASFSTKLSLPEESWVKPPGSSATTLAAMVWPSFSTSASRLARASRTAAMAGSAAGSARPLNWARRVATSDMPPPCRESG